jgi:hypothetical protein
MCQGTVPDLGIRAAVCPEVIDGHTWYLDQPAQLTPGLFWKDVAGHYSPAHCPMSMQAISPGQLPGRLAG